MADCASPTTNRVRPCSSRVASPARRSRSRSGTGRARRRSPRWCACSSRRHIASSHRVRTCPRAVAASCSTSPTRIRWQLKRDIVLDALHRQRIEHPAPHVHGAGDPWRYRLRGEFHVIAGKDGQPPALGFNRARSWRPIAVDDCLIHHPRITTALPALRALIAQRARRRSLSTLHLTAGEDGQELLVRAKPPRGLGARCARRRGSICRTAAGSARRRRRCAGAG